MRKKNIVFLRCFHAMTSGWSESVKNRTLNSSVTLTAIVIKIRYLKKYFIKLLSIPFQPVVSLELGITEVDGLRKRKLQKKRITHSGILSVYLLPCRLLYQNVSFTSLYGTNKPECFIASSEVFYHVLLTTPVPRCTFPEFIIHFFSFFWNCLFILLFYMTLHKKPVFMCGFLISQNQIMKRVSWVLRAFNELFCFLLF